MKFIGISLEVTNRCNLSCRYCYLKENDCAASTPRSHDMPTDVAVKSLTYLNRTTRKNPIIYFYGGEPLLNFKTIKSTVIEGRRLDKNFDYPIEFIVVTNGTLLNKQYISFFEKNDVHIQISLDGYKEPHDFHRKYKNGDGTHKKIIDNIEELRNSGCTYWCKITTTKQSLPIREIFNYLDTESIPKHFNSPAENNLPSVKKYLLNKNEIKDVAKKTVLNFEEKYILYGKIIDLRLKVYLEKIFSGSLYKYPCSAGSSTIGIDSYGNIYPCHRFFGLKKYIIGKVFIDICEESIFSTDFSVEKRQECKTCNIRYLCGGTCFFEAIINNTTLKSDIYCSYNKGVILELLNMITRINKKNTKKIISLMDEINNDIDILNYQNKINKKNMHETILLKLNVKAIDLGEDALLVKEHLNQKYIANTTAMAIWDLIDGSRTAQQITQEIANVCEVEFDTIKDDIYGQLAAFQELGLVEEVQAESHA